MFHARSIGNRLIAKIELKGGPRGGFNDLNRINSKLVANACRKLVTKRYFISILIFIYIALVSSAMKFYICRRRIII